MARLPGYMRKAQGEPEKPKPEPVSEQDRLDFFELATDHSRVHYIKIDGNTVEYVPLTVAEEVENGQYTDLMDNQHDKLMHLLCTMATKAIKIKVDTGQYLLEKPTPFEEAKYLLGELPPPYVLKFIKGIQEQQSVQLKKLELLKSHIEENAYSHKNKGFPRNKNPLDEHVGNLYVLENAPFTLLEVGQMTRLQFAYYTLVYNEKMIRASNDNNFQLDSKGDKPGKSGKKIKVVGKGDGNPS